MGEEYYLNKLITISIIVGLLVVVIVAVCLVARKSATRKYFRALMGSAEKLYFYETNLKKIIKTHTLYRLQNWAYISMCNWWAPLAMLLLRDEPTAVLYQGTLRDLDGTEKFHSWVEFTIRDGEKYVLDFSWLKSGYCSKKRYLKWLKRNKVELTPEWKCDYKTFWLFCWPNFLWKAMKSKKTSHIMEGLNVFSPEPDEDWGFKQTIADLQTNAPEGFGTSKVPWRITHSSRLVSAEIIQDFVRFPRIKEPTSETKKRAYRSVQSSK